MIDALIESLSWFFSFDWLFAPLEYQFFIRGLIAAVLAATAGGLLSGFIVWRGMAFIGDALAHVILPGIVIANLLGQNLLIGALVSSILAVLGIGLISRNRGIKEDTAIGIVFVGFFALGTLLLSIFFDYKHLEHILFGNVLGVNWFDIAIMSVLVVLIVLGILFFFKELLVTSFDKAHAVAIGLSPGLIYFGLLIATALTTVVTIQTVGVVLVLGFLITPAAIAGQFTKRLSSIVLWGTITSVLASLLGFFLSYHLNFPTGSTIVLILFSVFILSMGIKRLFNYLNPASAA
jgi:ABC-type Mn2+/Zn2+ transport system permease subunit